MTENILVNSDVGTLKVNRNTMSSNECFGRSNKRTWILFKLCAMNLTDMAELNKPTSAIEFWQI